MFHPRPVAGAIRSEVRYHNAHRSNSLPTSRIGLLDRGRLAVSPWHGGLIEVDLMDFRSILADVGGIVIPPGTHRGRFVKARFSRDILKSIGLAAWFALSSVLSVSAQDLCRPDHECCQVETRSCCTPAIPAPTPHSGPDCTCNHAGSSQTARPASTSSVRAEQRKDRAISNAALDEPRWSLFRPTSIISASQANSARNSVSVFRLTSRWRC